MSTACYLDSSVLLAHIYREPGSLPFDSLPPIVTSSLTRVECLRSIDRHRWQGSLSDDLLVTKRQALFLLSRSFRIVEMDPAILDRASGSFSVPLKTLDAIHLATALRLAEETEGTVAFATLARPLAAAARAYGLRVVGV